MKFIIVFCDKSGIVK